MSEAMTRDAEWTLVHALGMADEIDDPATVRMNERCIRRYMEDHGCTEIRGERIDRMWSDERGKWVINHYAEVR